MNTWEFQLPETIEITPQFLLGAWAGLHFLFAFGIHYLWVGRVRALISRHREHTSRTGREPRFCRSCMWAQLVPLLLWGLEFKIVQLAVFVVMWIVNLLLGGGISKPFNMRLHKKLITSFYPHCGHGGNHA